MRVSLFSVVVMGLYLALHPAPKPIAVDIAAMRACPETFIIAGGLARRVGGPGLLKHLDTASKLAG